MTSTMKERNLLVSIVGILLISVEVLLIEGFLLPGALGISMVPVGVFAVGVWFNTYRTSKKGRQKAI
jgi:hypothetical protein